MRRTTTRMLQLTLSLVLAAFLASCGGNSDEPVLVSVYSTQAYSGHGIAFSNNIVTTSGANGFGQLGNGNYLNTAVPTQVGSFTAVTAAVAGTTHCAVLDNGKVWTWGYNIYGQLGDGTVVGKNAPVEALVADGVKAIAAGGFHTLAVSSTNEVLAWGQNAQGQLGQPLATAFSSTAMKVLGPDGITPLSNVTAVAAGGEFSLALDSDGNVWAWGNNAYGQLGNDTSISSSLPVQVKKSINGKVDGFLTGIVAIAAGGSHALAIDATGNLWAWGYNYFGQLGTRDAETRTSAVHVATDGNASKIAAGLDHSLVLTSSGLFSAGYNALGQLGLGGTVGSLRYTTFLTQVVGPTGVGSFLTGVESIAAYGHFSMARVTSGKVYTWGDNSYGQLGVSGILNTATPTASGY